MIPSASRPASPSTQPQSFAPSADSGGPLRTIVRGLRDATGGRLFHLVNGQVVEVAASEVAGDVARVVSRLVAAGVRPGDRVGLMSENRYEWVLYDLGLLDIGAVSVCLPAAEFSDVDLSELAKEYGLALLVTSSQALGDRVASSWILNLDQEATLPPLWTRTVTEVRDPVGTDVYSIAFSSGTTGRLKALQVAQGGIVETMRALCVGWAVTPADRILVSLPLSNVQQRIMVYAALWRGFDVVVTEPARLFWALSRMSPTILIGPPALFEAVERRFLALPWSIRWLLHGAAFLTGLLSGRNASALRRRIFRSFHQAFGGRTRVLITGSAPSRLSTLRLFSRLGMPLYEAYGITEVGILACNFPGFTRLGSVGRPLERVWLADDGEIMVQPRSPQSLGYWGKARADEATTFLPDGVIATGDIGRFDGDGFLYIVGRKKQIIVTRSGAKLHPEQIEGRLESIPGVARAVVLAGDGIARLAAVVSLDVSRLGQSGAKLRKEVLHEIASRNREVEAHAQIDRVAFAGEPFSVENGTLTRSLKVNRTVVWDRFRSALLDNSARLEDQAA